MHMLANVYDGVVSYFVVCVMPMPHQPMQDHLSNHISHYKLHMYVVPFLVS